MTRCVATRPLEGDDLPRVGSIVGATGLFPPDMLADMAAPYLTGQTPHHWLVALVEDRVAGFAYAEPERMTEGTFNLLAIGVEPELQRAGIGGAIVRSLEERLRRERGRVLLVETSSLDGFAATRGFYAGQGYVEEARVRDFYADGEHKVVFWKRL